MNNLWVATDPAGMVRADAIVSIYTSRTHLTIATAPSVGQHADQWEAEPGVHQVCALALLQRPDHAERRLVEFIARAHRAPQTAGIIEVRDGKFTNTPFS